MNNNEPRLSSIRIHRTFYKIYQYVDLLIQHDFDRPFAVVASGFSFP